MGTQNIVKIDRATVQEYLPMLTHRGVFSNFQNLLTKDEIIEKEKERLSVKELTQEQERKVLAENGNYRTKSYVIRDYGDYVIGFSAKMYLDNIMDTERNLKDEVLAEHYSKEKIQEALKKINTYKLAHKLSLLILGEVYKQKKYEGVTILKKSLVNDLGYETKEKHVYADIREAIHSLRWLDYIIYKYNTKLKLKNDSKTTGNFIYNLSEDSTEFKLWVNPLFVGCVLHMMSDNSELSKDEKKELLQRGYINYPLDHIKETKKMSDGAYFLSNYLLAQIGNPKLNTKEYKVITVKYEKMLSESKIDHPRRNVRVEKLLKAIEEICFIEKIEPSVKKLKKMNSQQVENQNFRIYIPQQEKRNEK